MSVVLGRDDGAGSVGKVAGVGGGGGSENCSKGMDGSKPIIM